MVIVRGRWRTAVGLAAVGMAAALALTGCGNGADTASDSGAAPAEAPRDGGVAEAPQDGGMADERQPDTAAKEQGAPDKLEVDSRSIIYNGSITVRVDSPDAQAQRAVVVATRNGGFVGSDRRTSDGNRSQASLQLRIPADRFTDVVNELAKLGEEESREISTEDVTEQVVDLDARIATQQASVNRTRALLAQAGTIAEIVSVEAELAKREADLASLQARKRKLADLTSLSTITLELLGPEAAVSEDDDPDTGFVVGVKAGWKAFLASLEILLTVLGALLPWVIAIGLPIYGLVWLLRRLNGRRATRTPAAPMMGRAMPSMPMGMPQPTPPVRPVPPTRPGSAPAETMTAGTTTAGTTTSGPVSAAPGASGDAGASGPEDEDPPARL